MKILFFDNHKYEQTVFEKINLNYGHHIEFISTRLLPETKTLANSADAVCCFVNDQLDHEVIAHLASNKISCLLLRCAGFNNVDLDAARKFNVKVYRVPNYSPFAVAEHAMALLLCLNRKIHRAYNRVKEQNFSLDGLVGFDLHDKVVGVIGTGKIGSVFARIAKGFGCQLLTYDIAPNSMLEKEIGCHYVKLEELLENSDIISLHTPLTEETHYLMDAVAFSKIKPNAILINTGRGGLLDSKALISALKENRIAGAVLDVYEEEEGVFFEDLSFSVIRDDTLARLMTFPNVIITSHQGFLTEQALDAIATTTFENLQTYSESVQSNNQVTRRVTKQ